MDRNEVFSKVLAGNNAYRGLADYKITLVLVQSTNLMALAGISRATASEIAEDVLRRYEIEITPSNVGQTLSLLGIKTTITHGKSRYILDASQLENIRSNIENHCHNLETKLEASIKSFQVLPNRIQSLEKQWQDILKLRRQETELIKTIEASGQVTARLYSMQSRARQIQEQIEQANSLEKECEELTQTLNKFPSLTDRKKKLEIDIAAYKKTENDLIAQETYLQRAIEALKPRKGWVTLAALNKAIDRASQELVQINKELNRRKSFLDRILHRDEPT